MTPLERAARAVQEELGVYPVPAQFGRPAGWMMEGGVVDDQQFLDIVRAVLQAIREPSKGMVFAGFLTGSWDVHNGHSTASEEAANVWQAMIDVVLAEDDRGG